MAAFKPQPTITVYRGFPFKSAYVWSPFVTKLEARLRFAGVSYKTEAGSLKSAPRGKVPYIAISKNEGETPQFLSDSHLISQQLSEEGILPDLNANLTPVQRVHDTALRALLEEKLYFYQNYERWLDNFYTMRDRGPLAPIPWLIRVIIGWFVWRKINTGLYSQGTGRFNSDEINAFRQEVWENINVLLTEAQRTASSSDKVFWVFGGSEPTEADTTLFGFIASNLVCAAGPETQRTIRSFPAVIDYARRIHQTYFPDYESPAWV